MRSFSARGKWLLLLAMVTLIDAGFPSGVRADEIDISAFPTVRVNSSVGSTARRQLTPAEASKAPLLISKNKDGYVWASRDGRHLVHVESGIFHYFIEPGGAGFVKVSSVPIPTEAGDAKFAYLESLSLGLETITYWGLAGSFAP